MSNSSFRKICAAEVEDFKENSLAKSLWPARGLSRKVVIVSVEDVILRKIGGVGRVL